VSGCRIRSVKWKSGGEVRRLPTTERDEAQKMLVNRAAMIAGHYKPGELHGYVVFAWDKQGFNSVGYFIDQEGLIGRRLLPSFVADALRERMIVDGVWGQDG
jgi:hypothetical protein